MYCTYLYTLFWFFYHVLYLSVYFILIFFIMYCTYLYTLFWLFYHVLYLSVYFILIFLSCTVLICILYFDFFIMYCTYLYTLFWFFNHVLYLSVYFILFFFIMYCTYLYTLLICILYFVYFIFFLSCTVLICILYFIFLSCTVLICILYFVFYLAKWVGWCRGSLWFWNMIGWECKTWPMHFGSSSAFSLLLHLTSGCKWSHHILITNPYNLNLISPGWMLSRFPWFSDCELRWQLSFIFDALVPCEVPVASSCMMRATAVSTLYADRSVNSLKHSEAFTYTNQAQITRQSKFSKALQVVGLWCTLIQVTYSCWLDTFIPLCLVASDQVLVHVGRCGVEVRQSLHAAGLASFQLSPLRCLMIFPHLSGEGC